MVSKKLLVVFALFALLLVACDGVVVDNNCATGFAKKTVTGNQCLTKEEAQSAYSAVQNAVNTMLTATPPALTQVITTTSATPISAPAPAQPAVSVCTFPAPGNLDNMPKVLIEMAPENTWFHRVFNARMFHAPNWDGADSWFVSLALGPNSGGHWLSFANPGQVIYRAENTSVNWCLGVLTTSKWKDQFMQGQTLPAAINVRVLPNVPVNVVTKSGNTKTQNTSDGGDITIILPDDDGVVTIQTAFTTAAPTFESQVWWGPYDRSANINTVDAR